MPVMNEVVSFLKNSKAFFIATNDGTRPKVRPFGFVMEYEDKIYFVTGNQKPFFAQIKNNPYIEICAMNEKSEWLRLSGKAIIDSRIEVKKKAFEEEPNLVYAYQTVENPIFECFYLENAQAAFCSMTTPQRDVVL